MFDAGAGRSRGGNTSDRRLLYRIARRTPDFDVARFAPDLSTVEATYTETGQLTFFLIPAALADTSPESGYFSCGTTSAQPMNTSHINAFVR